jgi:superfamily II DNA or RNA helicase
MENKFKSTFSHKLIYVFGIDSESHKGLLKIGETTIHNIQNVYKIHDDCDELNEAAVARIDTYTKTAGISYRLFYTTLAINNKNKAFSDHDVHAVLIRSNIKRSDKNLNGAQEWFEVDLDTVKNAIVAVKEGRSSLYAKEISEGRTPIIFRPEQEEAITKTIKQFTKRGIEINTHGHMLWNAKMRFGKTLSALEVVKRMKFNKTLIITHRPVVKESWYEDFNKIFYDNPKYIYGSKSVGYEFDDLVKAHQNEGKSFVYFASMQDLRGSKMFGGRHDKNEDIVNEKWDFIINDEAHEGTQTDLGSKVLVELIVSTKKTKTLYLSGTPFNLLTPESNVTFKDEEVFTWDYVMEQKAKLDWVQKRFGDSNPYESLPKMNIYTYDLQEIIKQERYLDIEDKAFNFREFFKVWTPNLRKHNPHLNLDKSYDGKFVYEDDIRFFLNLLVQQGEHNYPFSTIEYRDNFRHTLWMLPGVKEAKALSSLLKKHPVFQHFDIVNVAGEGDEEVPNQDALKMVQKAITDNPEQTRSITLSCGRLTTGVTVPAWTAVFMLSGSAQTSASSYLQTIFRVQTPATIGTKMKTNCYVFDFAPDRTLKIIAEISNLSRRPGAVINNEAQIGDFLNFCPVIAIDGSQMKPYDVNYMLVQLKRATIDRVARNGFDDTGLYNDNLLNLTDVEWEKFQNLKKTLKAANAAPIKGDILINDQGLEDELREIIEKKKKELTDEEKELLKERRRKLKERLSAIAILRGIAIRIPLLIYGADIGIEEKIGVENFTNIIDDKSWVEFMPEGVSKEMFIDFSKYFDNEVFIEAGLKIRRQAKAADELPPLERVQALSDLFATFKNPDKETVLTPWRAVNMHMGETIGGANFYEQNYENIIKIDDNTSARWVDKNNVTKEIFNTDSHILEINSKSGLYPLYSAISIYLNVQNTGQMKNISTLWQEILNDNIFVICRTKMAAAITKRTLKGYKDEKEYPTNILVIEDIVELMKEDYTNNYENLVKKIVNKQTWKRGERGNMKFNAVIGNPPYQSSAKQQIYTDFYLLSRELGKVVSLVFPIGWQEPKNANNLSKLNTPQVKKDKQIVFIDNRQHVFPGISGAEWTNFILWIKGYDNKLNGAQLIYTNGDDAEEKVLPIEKSDIEKPEQIVKLAELVLNKGDFQSMQKITSVRKPYGLSTDVLDYPEKYNLPTANLEKQSKDDIKIYGLLSRKQSEVYVPKNYPFPRTTTAMNKYKVFVPYAWGNMDEKAGLGGAFSDIIIASPNEVCTESFQEQGTYSTFEKASYHAKYLMTRFARALLYLNKYSQHSTTAWGAVPVQDFKESWWTDTIDQIEERLFNKYNVPEDIRNFIRDNIQQKSEINIINL